MNLRFDKILIVRLGALGDIINCLPVLGTLRERFPKSYIAWAVEDKNASLLKGHPLLDDVFIFERRQWAPHWSTHPRYALSKASQFMSSMRRQKFDIALDLQGNLKSGLVIASSNAQTRVGFKKGLVKESNHRFTNHHVDLPEVHINRVERYLTLVKDLGIDTTKSTRPDRVKSLIYIPSRDQKAIDNYLESHSIKDRDFVIIHPGTSPFGAYKRWPSAHYAELVDKINQLNPSLKTILTWIPSERTLINDITSKVKQTKPVTDCVTKSITQLAALIKKARLFIGSDSGPLYLASILGIPNIGLFGPKDPIIYKPYFNADRSVLIRKDLPCSPCKKRTCAKPDCMTLISVEDVVTEVRKLLAKLEAGS
ncbi:glycosyltransferase family 9 protein [Planctomycetota bacterium]